MDLTQAYDHPANKLESVGETEAAKLLRGYESHNQVTFAALDNEALKELYSAWELDEDDDRRAYVLEAVGKLFGLE